MPVRQHHETEETQGYARSTILSETGQANQAEVVGNHVSDTTGAATTAV